MGRPRSRALGIRGKLLLVALALLLIPWMGYQYVRDMKSFLLQGQEQAMLLTARAVATVLHDRPELFYPQIGVADLIGEPRDLYAYSLSGYVRLDGEANDWGELTEFLRTYRDVRYLACTEDYDPQSLSFQNVLGYRGDYVYALFQVSDDHVVYRDPRYRRLNNSDHLRVLTQAADGEIRRYILTLAHPGRLSVYLMGPDWRYPLTGDPVYEVQGEWLETPTGYSVELRMPRYFVAQERRLAFAIGDVDDELRRTVDRIVGTAPPDGDSDEPVLGRVLLHSPEIAKILKGLDRPATRISIIDPERRVRAVVGGLTRASEQPPAYPPVPDSGISWLHDLLSPIYRTILSPPAVQFEDTTAQASHREGRVFASALAGTPSTERRLSLDRRAEIIVAAYPIWSGDDVIGAVAVEQTSNDLLTLQNQLLENVVSVTLVVFLLVTVGLITFASRITLRIRRLRDASERAIGPEGRLRIDHIEAEARARDELGDLSRSISEMLGRLTRHTRYLESMPDTLAHELSNPLNVVSSSLENLQPQVSGGEGAKYIDRALNGIRRLRHILTSLTEAANLEDALRSGQQEDFDLRELVINAVEGYRLAHPDRRFVLHAPPEAVAVHGIPESIAQLLDKLVDNAVDFSQTGAPIEIGLRRDGTDAVLEIGNEGASLPADMRERIFDPMVSVGKKRASQSRLGLGLYVVRLIAEFHKGTAQARNRDDGQGVVVTVRLPMGG